MEITFYGHSCFSVNIRDTSILFDPFISGNEKAAAIDVNSIKADYILLSHGHQDHIPGIKIRAMRKSSHSIKVAVGSLNLAK